MRIEIFDVGHGQCAVVTSPNGARMMVDCGTRWRSGRFWTPSLHFMWQRMQVVGLTNLDEDHLRNFGPVLKQCPVDWVMTNPTIGPREFLKLKKDGLGPGAKAYADWLNCPSHSTILGTPLPPDFGPVSIRWYWIPYSAGMTTNNLSLVIVVQYGAFKIAFTGDLEADGWRRMMANPGFLLDMMTVNVFVASHHGRESGCCSELFAFMRPELVIISDDEHQYDSQDTTDWYRRNCRGIPYVNNPFERRYVVTTRNDGSMKIDVPPNGGWLLQSMYVTDWPQKQPELQDLTLGALLGLGTNLSPQFDWYGAR